MTTLYYIRHGETDWNVEDRWQGQMDIPLNARGHAQAEKKARALAAVGFAAIYCSDLMRTRQTAAPLAQLSGLPVQYDVRLREIMLGEWQGKLACELEQQYPDYQNKIVSNPARAMAKGAESAVQVQERMLAATRNMIQCHPGQRVAVVSHGFAISMVWVHFCGYPIERAWDLVLDNEGWIELEIDQSNMLCNFTPSTGILA